MLTNHPRVRLGIYIASILTAVVAPFLAVAFPDYGAAATTAAGVLAAAAGVTATTNIGGADDPSQ